jgi:hypothetical protein
LRPCNALMRAPALKMCKYRGRYQSWVYKPCKVHHYKPKPAKAATVLRSSADRSHVVFAFVVILSMILIQKRYARAGS